MPFSALWLLNLQMTAIKEALTSVYGVTPKVQCLPPEEVKLSFIISFIDWSSRQKFILMKLNVLTSADFSSLASMLGHSKYPLKYIYLKAYSTQLSQLRPNFSSVLLKIKRLCLIAHGVRQIQSLTQCPERIPVWRSFMAFPMIRKDRAKWSVFSSQGCLKIWFHFPFPCQQLIYKFACSREFSVHNQYIMAQIKFYQSKINYIFKLQNNAHGIEFS